MQLTRKRGGAMAIQEHLLTLADGATLTLRRLEELGRDAYVAALPRLSERSKALRFAGPKPRLSSREVDFFMDVGHDGREALVALDPGTGELVAIARFAPFPAEPGVADVAVLVWDGWQGRGIGTAILRALVLEAPRHGLVELRATTLAENHGARHMLERAGFRRAGVSAGVADYALSL
jgi:RimJ/RimL family protein N-acetyltransferase